MMQLPLQADSTYKCQSSRYVIRATVVSDSFCSRLASCTLALAAISRSYSDGRVVPRVRARKWRRAVRDAPDVVARLLFEEGKVLFGRGLQSSKPVGITTMRIDL